MRQIITTLAVIMTLCASVQAQNVRTNNRLRGFNKIDVSGGYLKVILVQSDRSMIEVEGDRSLVRSLDYGVRGSTLNIEMDSRNFNRHRGARNYSPQLRVTIYSRDFNEIELSGAVSLVSKNVLRQRYLDVDISGASSARLDVLADRVRVDASGASNLEISGRVKDMFVDNSGSAKVELRGEGRTINLDLSGASYLNAGHFVTEHARVESSGASRGVINSDRISSMGRSGTSKIANNRERGRDRDRGGRYDKDWGRDRGRDRDSDFGISIHWSIGD